MSSSGFADRVGRAIYALILTAVLAVLVAPILLVAAVSFSDRSYFKFPPGDWGFGQYSSLLESEKWLDALWLSAKVTFPSSLIALVVGTAAVMVVYRSRLPGRVSLEALGLFSLLIPVSAYAVALYAVYAQLGLIGSYWGLVMVYALHATPVVMIAVGAGISKIPRETEMVAMSMGASRLRAMVGILGRLLLPAILGAYVLSAVVIFDEAVLVTFLGGSSLDTLPRVVLADVQIRVDPVISAVATLLMVATALTLVLGSALSKWGERENASISEGE